MASFIRLLTSLVRIFMRSLCVRETWINLSCLIYLRVLCSFSMSLHTQLRPQSQRFPPFHVLFYEFPQTLTIVGFSSLSRHQYYHCNNSDTIGCRAVIFSVRRRLFFITFLTPELCKPLYHVCMTTVF